MGVSTQLTLFWTIKLSHGLIFDEEDLYIDENEI